MKILFTILFIIGVECGVNAQCDSGRVDTARMSFDMKVPVKLWDYFHAGGLLLWSGVNKLDSSLIPEGGYVRQRMKDKNAVPGYGVLMVTDNKCHTTLWAWLDLNKKPLPGIVKYWEIK